MRNVHGWAAVIVAVLGVGQVNAAADEKEKGEGRLKLVEAAQRDDLDGVVSVTLSADGKFLYAASWKSAAVTAFARDAKTGKLAHKQTVADGETLAGTTTVALSPDGKFAAASAFQSKTVVLFQRDPETGELTKLDAARDGEKDVTLDWAIDVTFSPDGTFLYALDDHRNDAQNGTGAVLAFRIHDGKLEHSGTDRGKEDCYSGARGITLHPDGKTVFVACSDAGTLVVADRDPKTGVTKVRQIVKDEDGDVHGLAGVMGVVVSPDGRYVYTSAGRFHGDNAVSVFKFGTDGRLTFVQEFLNGQGDLQEFEGGNHLAMSPDGRNVYATATRSGTLAGFRRDPATGKLSYLETLGDGGDGGEARAAGVAVSPDGRFVYVATEDGKAVSVFERDAAK